MALLTQISSYCTFIVMKVRLKYESLKISKKSLISKYLKMQVGHGGKNWLRNYEQTE